MYMKPCAVMPLALLLALGACGSDDDEIFAKPLICPSVGVLSSASHLRISGGTGEPAYDLEFMRARLQNCELEKNRMTAEIRFEMRADRGPAMTENGFDFSYFVALLNPEGEVIDKTIEKDSEKFKSDRQQVFFARSFDDIKFEVPEGKDGAGYEILVGFQLSREQFEQGLAKPEIAPPDIEVQQ